MNKYTKIVSFDVGTERPTIEYCEQLEAQVERFKEEIGKLKHHLSPEGEYSITRSDGEPMSWESLVVSNILLELDGLLEEEN